MEAADTPALKEGVPSPYLAARREWNERYGSYIAAARSWRLAAFGALAVAVAAVGGVVYFAGQNKLIPYLVEIHDDRPIQVTFPGRMPPADPRIIRAQLAQFIWDFRTVTPDAQVQNQAVERLYAHLNPDSAAYLMVNEWMRENIPFQRAAKETVAVEVTQVLPISERTWRLEWLEHPRQRDGKPLPSLRMTALATVGIAREVPVGMVLLNPIGLYVDALEWGEELGDME
ncbi:MAG: VirB8/TrbF family protein [Candidatus Tectomicrobia bacterium]|nr:VirB8/TrbF family protein [Candidatus Tectomicrobia bacterium]